MIHHATQHDDGESRLTYANAGGFWTFFHVINGGKPARVGPHYPTRAALLADMRRYAAEFGFDTDDDTNAEAMRALELAERILRRDGLQAIRGKAWTDGELERIQSAIRAGGGVVVADYPD